MYQITEMRASALVLNAKREYHSFFSDPKKDSATALSWQLPVRPTERPMVAAVQRTSKERGRCVIRVVPDCSGDTHGTFAEEHIDVAAHVRADGWRGISGGLKGWPGLDQRKFDESDDDASLPTVHHVISNFEAWALGTFHGLSLTRLQSFADEFSWRYSHRGRDATTALLADCCAGYYTREQLKREVFLPQPLPPKKPKRRPGRPRKHPVLRL